MPRLLYRRECDRPLRHRRLQAEPSPGDRIAYAVRRYRAQLELGTLSNFNVRIETVRRLARLVAGVRTTPLSLPVTLKARARAFFFGHQSQWQLREPRLSRPPMQIIRRPQGWTAVFSCPAEIAPRGQMATLARVALDGHFVFWATVGPDDNIAASSNSSEIIRIRVTPIER